MTEAPLSQEEIDRQKALFQLHDGFKNASPSQDLLEDVSVEVLPEEYRSGLRLRMDRNNFFIAFSDNPLDLEPTEEGYVPNAHIKRLPAMTMPRRLGVTLKEWVDGIREEESKHKQD